MKQSLEQLMIVFTTNSQLVSLSKIYLKIANEDGEKEIVKFLETYLAEKENISYNLLEFIQNIKDQIAEDDEDEWAIEVGSNLGLSDSKENLENIQQTEIYLRDILYPECAEILSSEGLIDISSAAWQLQELSKNQLTKISKLI